MVKAKDPEFESENARRFWADTVADFELSRHEKVILEAACREQDIVERLEAELKDANLMAVGSMGQPVANPLLSEVRQHRNTVAALIKQLRLPEDGEGEKEKPNPRSTSARAAAAARWGTGGA